MNRPTCPNCGKQLVMPAGPPKAMILLVGEFPGVEEMKQGRPFVGKTGEILATEAAKVGIQLSQCRMTNLWLHQVLKKGEKCNIDFHLKNLMSEIEGRRFILLMGSDVIKTLCRQSVMDTSSLRVVSQYIPKEAIAISSPNPASAIYGGIGEFRLALKAFKEALNVP